MAHFIILHACGNPPSCVQHFAISTPHCHTSSNPRGCTEDGLQSTLRVIAITHFVKGNDVSISLPTGSGKSPYYASIPVAFDSLRR